jgi:glucose-6-phosphate isomerase
MIRVETNTARGFLNEGSYGQAAVKAEQSFKQLQNETGKGPEWLGWRRTLASPDDALLEEIDSLAASIRQQADIFIVCGIGGSYLGSKAVIEALGPELLPGKPEILYAGHNMSGRYLEELLAYISRPGEDGTPRQVYMNVISKSGTTIETALAFRVLRTWIHETYGENATGHIVCTTSAEGGALNKIIRANGYRKFVLPDDIGGRFSVLTPVGLLPIAVSGVDIRTLFYGAVNAYELLEKEPEMVLDYAATRFALYGQGYRIDVFTSFEPHLRSFGGWMQQLMGESEGKNGKGLFPVLLGYSTDLHSVGQLVQDGHRNIIETFLVVNRAAQKLRIEADADDHDGLNYLQGRTFHDINTKAFEGTREAHTRGGVPPFTVVFDELNAESVGQAIYFFELATAVYVYCLGENPFDQPGVEDYKKEMYRLLGKPV